jgi:hypothetical protein
MGLPRESVQSHDLTPARRYGKPPRAGRRVPLVVTSLAFGAALYRAERRVGGLKKKRC